MDNPAQPSIWRPDAIPASPSAELDLLCDYRLVTAHLYRLGLTHITVDCPCETWSTTPTACSAVLPLVQGSADIALVPKEPRLQKSSGTLKRTWYRHSTSWWWWLLFYSAILRSRADSLRSHVILHEWLAFIARFWISTEVVYLQRWHGWCHMKLLPSRGKFCVHHTTMHHVTSCKATYVRCIRELQPATCNRHFWQNDRDLLRATAVTRGWNGYRNKSQHRKLTLENKILPPLLQGFEPATFQSRVRRSNHWATPLLINTIKYSLEVWRLSWIAEAEDVFQCPGGLRDLP